MAVILFISSSYFGRRKKLKYNLKSNTVKVFCFLFFEKKGNMVNKEYCIRKIIQITTYSRIIVFETVVVFNKKSI